MISHEELQALLGLAQANAEAIQINTAELKRLNNRLDNFENAVVEIEDITSAVATDLREVQALATKLQENTVRQKDFDHYLKTNQEKFEYLGGLLFEVTGMPVKETLVPTRFGERVSKIENEYQEFKTKYVYLLGLISDSLIEVQGQISNPFSKKTAIQALREEISKRKRGFE